MDREQPFLVLRYFLIEEDQRAINPEPLPKVKGKAVLIALSQDLDWVRNGVRYSFVGFSLADPHSTELFPSNRFYVGKLAKLRKTHVGEKIPGDIIEHEEDDWIPLITIVDTVNQSIVIQQNWRFGTPQQICNAVQAGLRDPIFAKYNHRIFVEPKPTQGKFWEIVRSHNKLYKLEFGLISPNILQTNVKARQAVKALQDLFGQDEITVRLKNDSGSLNVPDKPTSDYIEEGEGTWRLTTEGSHGGKKTYNSADAAEIINLEIPDDKDISSEQQIEIETGKPVPTRQSRDRGLVERVYRFIGDKIGS